jgi:hypothetical protein
METLSLVLGLIFSIGLTLGVGASTFALINFIVAIRDGVIDESEKRLMSVVYVVLRIGMALIAVGLVGPLLLYGLDILNPVYLIVITLLVIVTLNAILMTMRKMPMKYGAVIAGGSWYAMFLVTELPLYDVSYPVLLMLYAAFVLAFYVVFESLKLAFLPGESQRN